MPKERKKKKPLSRVKKFKLPRGEEFDAYAPAIIDGEFKASVHDYLILRRPRYGGDMITRCVVKRIDGGNIYLWDETMDQWFTFDPHKDLSVSNNLKLTSQLNTIAPDESLDDIAMNKETDCMSSGVNVREDAE